MVVYVVTVSEALARARADGIPISEYSLRRWLKTNQIPCRMAGTKTLIYYPHIIEFFTRVPASQLVAQEIWKNHDSE